MKGSRLLFMASWVILLLMAALIGLGSIASTTLSYSGGPDQITPTFTMEQISSVGGQEVANALQGRRVTAATWALGYVILMGFVVLVPYRRGERWAWWAILVSILVSQILSLARVMVFGSNFGSGTSAMIMAFALLGLLAGAPRMFARRAADLDL